MKRGIKRDDWLLWLILALLVLLALWLIFGHGDYDFVGLAPLEPDSNYGIDSITVHNIARSIHRPTRVKRPNANVSVKVNTKPKPPNANVRKVIKCSKGEAECRRCLEEMFGLPFSRVRPAFLKNPETSRKLELDCYNESLKLAVEYNGIQHYMYPNFTGQSYEKFLAQLRRDTFKVEECDRRGVYLITVPYTVKIGDIYSYIRDRMPSSLEHLMTKQ